jgi:hypothetical protein
MEGPSPVQQKENQRDGAHEHAKPEQHPHLLVAPGHFSIVDSHYDARTLGCRRQTSRVKDWQNWSQQKSQSPVRVTASKKCLNPKICLKRGKVDLANPAAWAFPQHFV